MATYLLAMLLLCAGSALATKDTTMVLDRSEWEALTEDVDYSENYRTDDPSYSEPPSQLEYNLDGLKYVFYALAIILLVVFLLKIAMNVKSNPDIDDKELSIEVIREAEENLPEVDLDKLLQEALASKNYAFALHINFLMIIKDLTLQDFIRWTKEKTNWEYLSELKKKALQGDFKDIVLSFEKVWYGEQPLTREAYEGLRARYEDFGKKVRSYEQE